MGAPRTDAVSLRRTASDIQRRNSSPLLAVGVRVLTVTFDFHEGSPAMSPQLASFRLRLARRTLPHGQRPTEMHCRVFARLIRHPDHTPTHRELADAAGCCVRTVGNALRRAAGLGLLSWTRRRTELPDGTVWQLANRYIFVNSLLFLFTPPKPKKVREEVLFIVTKDWVGKLSEEARQLLRAKYGLA